LESFNVGADLVNGKYSVSLDIYKNSNASGSSWTGNFWWEYDLIGKYQYTKDIEFYAGYGYATDEKGSDNWWNSRAVMGVNWKFGNK